MCLANLKISYVWHSAIDFKFSKCAVWWDCTVNLSKLKLHFPELIPYVVSGWDWLQNKFQPNLEGSKGTAIFIVWKLGRAPHPMQLRIYHLTFLLVQHPGSQGLHFLQNLSVGLGQIQVNVQFHKIRVLAGPAGYPHNCGWRRCKSNIESNLSS